MALAHKGLEATSIPWRFTEKAAIARHRSDKVPVLLDGEREICHYFLDLEATEARLARMK